MDSIGTLEVVQVEGEEENRYCIHLKKPNVDDVRNIKHICKKHPLELGLYNIDKNYTFTKIERKDKYAKRS